MRTTLAIDDRLLRSAKSRAHRRGMTLGRLVEEALRRELARTTEHGPRPAIPVFSGGSGAQPGVDVSSNRGLLETLDEDRSLEQLR